MNLNLFKLVLVSSFIISGCQPDAPKESEIVNKTTTHAAARSLDDQAYLVQLMRDAEIADNARTLVHVSHTCTLTIDQQAYAVVDVRELVQGAMTARGVNQIILLNSENQLVNRVEYGNSRPLLCDENKLYLYGDVIPDGQAEEGNVLIYTDSGFMVTAIKEDVNSKLPMR